MAEEKNQEKNKDAKISKNIKNGQNIIVDFEQIKTNLGVNIEKFNFLKECL